MKNRSLWKKAVLAVLLVSSLTFTTFSQENAQVSTDGAVTAWETSESYFSSPVQSDATGTAASSGAMRSTGSTVWVFVRMILFLAIFVAAIYGVLYYIKKRQNKIENDDEFLRRVSGITLAPGKTVEIITLIDKAYILGVSDAGINLIAEVTDKELIDAMNVYADKTQNTVKSRSFAEVLELFTSGPKRNNGGNGSAGANGNIFGEGNTGLADLLKKTKAGAGEEE